MRDSQNETENVNLEASYTMTVTCSQESEVQDAETMTKKSLIQAIAQECKLHPHEVRGVIQSFLDKVTHGLSRGGRLEFRDFGVFEVVDRKQKIGRNPKNASVPIVIPARRAVKFTPGKKMRQVIEHRPDLENEVS